MGRFATLVLVLMLVMMSEIGPMVGEARKCESQSHKFKGTCLSDTNCGSVCKTEGFTGGKCTGFRRRCFCTKHC
uniref:Defensin 1 n=1 Tax=Ocimum basilicum TaxID=39350 RepID=A0A7D5T125_OCIBA|nr:defensin 1 [Ocimum basilicum]QLH55400.1 defensin 1 [Ocimum basilicum]